MGSREEERRPCCRYEGEGVSVILILVVVWEPFWWRRRRERIWRK
jgi:hypothetical protein